MSTRSSLAALTAALVLGTGGSAAAAAPGERVLVDRFDDPYAFAVDCGDFGPYAFQNLVSGTQRLRIVDIVAADGTVLQRVFSTNFRETDANSVTGTALPLRGAIREVWDYATNTRTLTGAVYIGTRPGAGTYLQDTGRITMTLDTRIASFVAGPKAVFFGGGIDPMVCGALATA